MTPPIILLIAPQIICHQTEVIVSTIESRQFKTFTYKRGQYIWNCNQDCAPEHRWVYPAGIALYAPPKSRAPTPTTYQCPAFSRPWQRRCKPVGTAAEFFLGSGYIRQCASGRSHPGWNLALQQSREWGPPVSDYRSFCNHLHRQASR